MEWERKRVDDPDLGEPFTREPANGLTNGIAQAKRTGDYPAIWLSILTTAAHKPATTGATNRRADSDEDVDCLRPMSMVAAGRRLLFRTA